MDNATKSKTVVVIGSALSLICMFIYANAEEDGDANAISMYFVVFLFPVILIAIINAVYLKALNRIANKIIKCILSIVPTITFLLLGFREELILPGIDGNLIFVARVGTIGIGITNIIWMIATLNTKIPNPPKIEKAS
jgi:hypothetical protein